jgi:hypothetical protein
MIIMCFLHSRPILKNELSTEKLSIATNPEKLRDAVCCHMLKNSIGLEWFPSLNEFEKFVSLMRVPKTWAEDVFVFATAHFLQLNLFFMSLENDETTPLTKQYTVDDRNKDNLSKCLLLGYLSQVHFQSLLLPSEALVNIQTWNLNQRSSMTKRKIDAKVIIRIC